MSLLSQHRPKFKILSGGKRHFDSASSCRVSGIRILPQGCAKPKFSIFLSIWFLAGLVG